MLLLLLPVLLQTIPADSGEFHLRNIRQLTFGGQNAEAYFSRSGRQLIFQRQAADTGCDQQYVMNVDGTGMRRVSSGAGRTTCGYFFDHDRRLFYFSTNPGYDAEGTLSPDGRTIVFTSLRDGDLDIYTMRVDGTHLRRLTHTLGYDGGPFFSPDGKQIVRSE